MEHYAGIDVSLETVSVCIVDETGKVLREARVASEPDALVAWFRRLEQMRWSRQGADLLLQVRSAVYNGTLDSGFGHRFEPLANADMLLAKAA
jgi:predicted NBD/HSP70 family sugar kinase